MLTLQRSVRFTKKKKNVVVSLKFVYRRVYRRGTQTNRNRFQYIWTLSTWIYRWNVEKYQYLKYKNIRQSNVETANLQVVHTRINTFLCIILNNSKFFCSNDIGTRVYSTELMYFNLIHYNINFVVSRTAFYLNKRKTSKIRIVLNAITLKKVSTYKYEHGCSDFRFLTIVIRWEVPLRRSRSLTDKNKTPKTLRTTTIF
jgi:hypothetical protein